MNPKINFIDGVNEMVDNMYWKSTIMGCQKIKTATKDWFKYMQILNKLN